MALFTRLIVTLFGMAFAVLLTAAVLVWITLFVAFAVLRWLVTGQKPQVVVMWQQIQVLRQGMKTRTSARWFSRSEASEEQWQEASGHVQPKALNADVVEDVVAREVQNQPRQPKS